jgi:hypothetical protein
MNNLSWMLYFAEVCENIGVFFCIIGLIGTLISLIAIIISYCFMSDYRCYNEVNNEGVTVRFDKNYLFARGWFKTARCVLPVCFFLWTVGLALPSKQTIYLIIASETGEEVIKSETGKKALEAVNRYLDKVAVEDNPAEEGK